MAVNYEDYSVLVVDDESFTRQIVRNLLTQIGVRRIHEAPDGKAGLLELLRVKPSLVLCDIHMKPVDGRQFLKTVRETKVARVAATPVIFLTADCLPDTVKFAKEHNANGYLVKPVSLAQLKQRVDAVIAQAAPAPPE
jgi:two-component system chemotaxis response regulator CheY